MKSSRNNETNKKRNNNKIKIILNEAIKCAMRILQTVCNVHANRQNKKPKNKQSNESECTQKSSAYRNNNNNKKNENDHEMVPKLMSDYIFCFFFYLLFTVCCCDKDRNVKSIFQKNEKERKKNHPSESKTNNINVTTDKRNRREY